MGGHAGVVRRSGIVLEPDDTEREEASARCRLADAGLRRLDELSELEADPDVLLDRLRRGLTARLDDARDRLTDDSGTTPPAESAGLTYRQPRRDLITVESRELQRLYDDHTISDTTRRRLQRTLDLEERGWRALRGPFTMRGRVSDRWQGRHRQGVVKARQRPVREAASVLPRPCGTASMEYVNSAWLLFDRPPSPARQPSRGWRCPEAPASR
ncbi:hypothetical protein [Streptomyces sp. NPDC050546]|uniref:hypothetical protein n=1 Tax=Streptomyces sp. NPDC050546 TaxID=3365628 RepID=UPI0037B9074D